MAPLVTISNDALPGKYEKNYQNSAHGISWLSWLGWSGIFLCHSRLILRWIIFPCHSYDSYHIGEYFCVIHVSYDGGQLPPTDTLTKALAPIHSLHPPLYIHPCPANYLNVRKAASVCMYKGLFSVWISDVAKMKILSLRSADGRCVSNVKSHIYACYCKTFHKT